MNVRNTVNHKYILTSKKNKGDSGHFIELSYGKCDDFLITKLLFEMKNKGKLINRPDLFTDSGETLKMYISLRRKIEKKKITYNFNNTLSIENEIIKMKSLVDECEKSGNKTINFELNEGKNENKHQLLQKKRNKDFENIDIEEDKNKKVKYSLSQSKEIKELKAVHSNNKDKKFWSIEKMKNLSRQQILEIAKKRIIERFDFKFDETLRHNMIQKLKELDANDPYYQDLIFLIGEYRKIV